MIKNGLKLMKMIFWLIVITVLVFGGTRLAVIAYARGRSFGTEQAPSAPVAIVLGAGLSRDGSPSQVLQDRVTTAARLYFAGKVQKLLMSGDNRFVSYNEPAAMRKFAMALGVPASDIVEDFAGRRTYDTCYRARAIFGVKQAIVVTQNFHLPRALILCNANGIAATGVSADLRSYSPGPFLYWNLREIPATLVSIWESYITHPLPVLGQPEPIFPEGKG